MKRNPFICAALAVALVPGLALADDPNDPAMHSAGARARDREIIRQLNRAELARVRERDAGYAAGWRTYRDGGAAEADSGWSDRSRQSQDYARARADHARDQAAYQRDLARWRRAVAACRSGDYSACEG